MKNYKTEKSRRKREYAKISQKTQIQVIGKSKNQFAQAFKHPLTDLYHWLLVISWWNFLIAITLFYLITNILFAFAYLIAGDGIANAKPGSFSDAFFFSVQTMSTIGYGSMYPTTFYTQVLMTIEVLGGTLLVAILTGLIFARFSRPTARLIFSRVCVICPFNEVPTLMFRVANQRHNRILEAQIRVTLLRNEVSLEGHNLRRLYDLPLLRSETPSFHLSWSVMHPIDPRSPLYQATPNSLSKHDTQIIVTLTGLDETFSQTIHSRYSYTVSEILWNMRFVDIFSKRPNTKQYKVDYDRFHNVVPVGKIKRK
ncbi:MAG: ion channel [Prochloraceae cyanobacterium]|nr:ion channel [Prochloraceae cyanobacterium]